MSSTQTFTTRSHASATTAYWTKLAAAGLCAALWFGPCDSSRALAATNTVPAEFSFTPTTANQPVGVAKGIFPGRVVWIHDPLAAHWAGNWNQKNDQWWLDANTDQTRVDGMLKTTLLTLTGMTNTDQAWQAIFEHFNKSTRQLEHRGYQPGERIVLKINLNNSDADKTNNYTDATPQVVLSTVRQLVYSAQVRQEDIIIVDARRDMPPYLLTKIWNEFKDVRFVQNSAPKPVQPKNPSYGDYHGLEVADWVQGIEYSNGKYKDAKLIPKQVLDATYLINEALLKAHSYPFNTMEDGDSGQTAITMTGKNHFGSIKGTPELHAAINTAEEASANKVYSPIVDLAASPNLGAKTILYLLDGLYCGRKWRTYPIHFPNPPFNNPVEPYENPNWPSSLLASFDGVALDSVGLDLLLAQTKNNDDAEGRPRILIRKNADDHLFEMAQADKAPSGTVYTQAGKQVQSLGVHERWDSDATMRYSRNLDPVNGKGIELLYVPMSSSTPSSKQNLTPPLKAQTPAPAAKASHPAELPGKGLAQHDFMYAGEAMTRDIYIVRGGKVTWSFHDTEGKGEISDAVLLSNGNILFAHQFAVRLINQDKKTLWTYEAPLHCEIHTAQPIGLERVIFVQSGPSPKIIVANTRTGLVEREISIPAGNPASTHGQLRHARLTDAGTYLLAHMDLGKAAEYDSQGREVWAFPYPGIWSAVRLKSGNTLLCGKQGIQEITAKGEKVWEFTSAQAPGYTFDSMQIATRLPNGNTLVNHWVNQWSGKIDLSNAPVQFLEVTPDHKIIWALHSWSEPNLGPSTTIQLLEDATPAEATHFGGLR